MTIDHPEKARRRYMSGKLQVMENMVRSRLQSGEPLTAQEIIDGVRLPHDEFLYFASLAMRELNRDFAD